MLRTLLVLVIAALVGCGQNKSHQVIAKSYPLVDLSDQSPSEFKDQGNYGVCYFYGYVAGLEAAVNRHRPSSAKISIDEEAAKMAYINLVLSPPVENCATCDFIQSLEKKHFIMNLYGHFNFGDNPISGEFDFLNGGSVEAALPIQLATLPLFQSGALTSEELTYFRNEIQTSVLSDIWEPGWKDFDVSQIFALNNTLRIKFGYEKLRQLVSGILKRLDKSRNSLKLSMPKIRVIQISPVADLRKANVKSIQDFISTQLHSGLPLVAAVDINGIEIGTSPGSDRSFLPIFYEKETGHMMLLTGIRNYMDKNGNWLPYYIFRNSWGKYGVARIPVSEAYRFEELYLVLAPRDIEPVLPNDKAKFSIFDSSKGYVL